LPLHGDTIGDTIDDTLDDTIDDVFDLHTAFPRRFRQYSRREDTLLTVCFSIRIINHIPVKSRRDDTLLIG
jgi:hypothetical protein